MGQGDLKQGGMLGNKLLLTEDAKHSEAPGVNYWKPGQGLALEEHNGCGC